MPFVTLTYGLTVPIRGIVISGANIDKVSSEDKHNPTVGSSKVLYSVEIEIRSSCVNVSPPNSTLNSK